MFEVPYQTLCFDDATRATANELLTKNNFKTGVTLEFTDLMESFTTSQVDKEYDALFKACQVNITDDIVLIVRQPRPAYLFARFEGDGWETTHADAHKDLNTLSYEIIENSPKAYEFLRTEQPVPKLPDTSPFSVLFNAMNIAARCEIASFPRIIFEVALQRATTSEQVLNEQQQLLLTKNEYLTKCLYTDFALGQCRYLALKEVHEISVWELTQPF